MPDGPPLFEEQSSTSPHTEANHDHGDPLRQDHPETITTSADQITKKTAANTYQSFRNTNAWRGGGGNYRPRKTAQQARG